jgi:hypothetical protein
MPLKRPISAAGYPNSKWLFNADGKKLHSDGSEQYIADVIAFLRKDGYPSAAAHIEAHFQCCSRHVQVGLEDEVAAEIVAAVNAGPALGCVAEGYRIVPVEPTREMLAVIVYDEYPEDWDAGKIAQRRLGLSVIPPKTEFEIAYGQYRRLLAAAAPGGKGE